MDMPTTSKNSVHIEERVHRPGSAASNHTKNSQNARKRIRLNSEKEEMMKKAAKLKVIEAEMRVQMEAKWERERVIMEHEMKERIRAEERAKIEVR